jgi:hypothetical protein
MTTSQTFSLVRLLFGLVGVSILCTLIYLVPKPWIPYRTWWIWEYVLLLLLPTVGIGCVLYWSRVFAKLDALQRWVVASVLAFFLALGFTIAFLDCVLPIWGMFYKPPFQEGHLQSGYLPVQDVRYGYHGDQLLFVVFQTSVNGESHTQFKIAPAPDPMTTPGHVIITHYDHWIELPDGTRKDLPSSRTMFEYVGGPFFKSRQIDVTLDEFRGWLASRPQIYSIEKLEEFVADQRQQR